MEAIRDDFSPIESPDQTTPYGPTFFAFMREIAEEILPVRWLILLYALR